MIDNLPEGNLSKQTNNKKKIKQILTHKLSRNF